MFWVWHPEEEEGSAASKVGIKLELANHHHNKGGCRHLVLVVYKSYTSSSLHSTTIFLALAEGWMECTKAPELPVKDIKFISL